jgi:4-amino-4-deoxy-L-arabinose transferase-like glycosyltransferase
MLRNKCVEFQVIASIPTRVMVGGRSLLEMIRGEPLVCTTTVFVGVLHLIVAGRYDIFRNELYFIVCGRHPDFGYVDQPPLIPLIAAATQALGDNVWLLRLPAAIAAAALVPLTASFARLLGGNERSASIAGIAAGIAPALAALTSVLTTSTLEPIGWTASAYLLTRAIVQRSKPAMFWAGAVVGISMEAKYGIAIWLIALAIGTGFTPARRILLWRPFWLAIAIATAIGAPSLIWQQIHGWPFREVNVRHFVDGTNFTGTPLQFEQQQILAMNLLLAPLWITGILAPFLSASLRPARFLSIGFVAATAIVFVTHGKDYYLFPAYPTLFAVGGAACAHLWRWLLGLWMATATAVFILAVPVALPILEPAALERYLRWTHLAPPPEEAAAVGAPLTQLFSDELGWRELERKVAAIYRSLPPEEQAHTAIVTTNYGEAAALDVYGVADGLPPALCGQNQYFLWGDHGYDGRVIIHINGDPERWRRGCERVETIGRFGVTYAMPYENERPIFVCRGLRRTLDQIWDRLKRYQ